MQSHDSIFMSTLNKLGETLEKLCGILIQLLYFSPSCLFFQFNSCLCRNVDLFELNMKIKQALDYDAIKTFISYNSCVNRLPYCPFDGHVCERC